MPPLPSTMKAVSMAKTGPVSVLEYTDHPLPRISATQLLVRNAYAGVNFIDTYFRTGQYPLPAGASLPLILGQDAIGQVVQVGAAAAAAAAVDSVHSHSPSVSVGTHVIYMPALGGSGGGGTYAEYTAVEAAAAVPVPTDVDPAAALAVFLQGLTAWTFIRRAAAGAVQPGDWALVHAAAGGVGSLLVQMLKRVVGARVIATASSPEKRRVVAEELGADHVLDSLHHHHPGGGSGDGLADMIAKVKEITGGRGVNCIFDGVGQDTFAADLQTIAMGGSLVMIGSSSGNVDPIDIRTTLGPKNIRLARPVLWGYLSDRASLDKWSTELFDLVRAGTVKPMVHAIYDLKDAAQAHVDIASRNTMGKLLIKIN